MLDLRRPRHGDAGLLFWPHCDYERSRKTLREYPEPDQRAVQTSLLNPKARVAPTEDFIDASLIEEISKSGFLDRLYGKAG